MQQNHLPIFTIGIAYTYTILDTDITQLLFPFPEQL